MLFIDWLLLACYVAAAAKASIQRKEEQQKSIFKKNLCDVWKKIYIYKKKCELTETHKAPDRNQAKRLRILFVLLVDMSVRSYVD